MQQCLQYLCPEFGHACMHACPVMVESCGRWCFVWGRDHGGCLDGLHDAPLEQHVCFSAAGGVRHRSGLGCLSNVRRAMGECGEGEQHAAMNKGAWLEVCGWGIEDQFHRPGLLGTVWMVDWGLWAEEQIRRLKLVIGSLKDLGGRCCREGGISRQLGEVA